MSYWVENKRKIYCQSLRDEHTPLTSELKSSLENIRFVWTIEKGSGGKGPIRKGKKNQKGICDGSNMTHARILLLDADRADMGGNMPPPSSGKDIKGMCNRVENERPIGTEATNQGQDGNFDCETNGEQPRLSLCQKKETPEIHFPSRKVLKRHRNQSKRGSSSVDQVRVGTMVRIFFQDEEEPLPAYVTEIEIKDRARRAGTSGVIEHTLVYQDGIEEKLDLSRENFEITCIASDSAALASSTDYVEDAESSNAKIEDTTDGALVGSRIEVFWPDDNEFYTGTVIKQWEDHASSAFLSIVHYGK